MTDGLHQQVTHQTLSVDRFGLSTVFIEQLREQSLSKKRNEKGVGRSFCRQRNRINEWVQLEMYRVKISVAKACCTVIGVPLQRR